MKIILGSQSKNRKKVLHQMGYEFEALVSGIDEKAIRYDDPSLLTLELAKVKAAALLPQISEEALLITSDQVVLCNGELREKPANEAEARRFFNDYASYPAQTITSVVVTNTKTGEQVSGVDTACVYFNPFPESVIDSLISEGSIFSYAGGYSIDDPLAIPYVEKIEGEPESILGLPKTMTLELLAKLDR